jgi:hypothetical protein
MAAALVLVPTAMTDVALGSCVPVAWRSAVSMAGSFGVCHAQFEAVGNVEHLPAAALGHYPHDGAVTRAVVHAAFELNAAAPAEVDGVADLDVVPKGGAAGGPILLQGHEDS